SFPNVSLVVVMSCPGSRAMGKNGTRLLGELRTVARALGVELLGIAVREPGDSSLALAFKEAIIKRVEALLISDCPPAFPPRQTVDLAAKSRLPAIYPWVYYAKDS